MQKEVANPDVTQTRDVESQPIAPQRPHLSGHMPALDGVRGLAILMVLMFHLVGNTQPTNSLEGLVVRITNYGSFGVELFFILSGFLITGILYDSRDKPHHFRNFYMRRILRIFPLYYSVLILVFLLAPLIPILQGPTLYSLIERQAWAWLYAINIYIAKTGEWSFSYLQHFWSLAVEEHFYLFWPFIVFALARRPRVLIAVSLAIAVSAFLARMIGSLAGLNWWTTYVFTPFRLDGLALGAFMAVFARQPGGLERLIRTLPRAAAIAGTVFLATFAWSRMTSSGASDMVLLMRAGSIEVLLACLLLYALTAPTSAFVSKFFRHPYMMLLGTYSYGLYVYHHFISYYFSSQQTEFVIAQWLGSHSAAVALQAVVGSALSLALAYLSYEHFEKRFLAMKRIFNSPGAGST